MAYTIRTTSPAGLYLPFYMRTANSGYNTCIAGNGAIAGANVLQNCTGYSQGRMMEMYNESVAPITSAGSNPFYMFSGDAQDWYQTAIDYGFSVGSTPQNAAVGVWFNSSDDVGHVANVEQYNSSSGYWEISESHYFYDGTGLNQNGSWDYWYLLNDSDYHPAFIGADSRWRLLGFIYPFSASPGPTPDTNKYSPWYRHRRRTSS